MTHYQRVAWHHDLDDEPSTLWSEVDDERFEIRKIEVYRDGHADIASGSMSTGRTMLSETALPTAADIALGRVNSIWPPRDGLIWFHRVSFLEVFDVRVTVALGYWWRQTLNEEASRSTTSAATTRPLLALSRSTGSTVSEVVGPTGGK